MGLPRFVSLSNSALAGPHGPSGLSGMSGLSGRCLRVRLVAVVLSAIGAAGLPTPADACPVRIPLGPIAADSAIYRVYRFQPNPAQPEAKGTWQQVPWQLLSSRGKQAPADSGMTLSRYFGPPAPAAALAGPCGHHSRPAYQLREFIGGDYLALYWFACPASAGQNSKTRAGRIKAAKVSQMNRSVVTPDYYYQYEGQNKLLFSSLALSKASKGSYHLIATAANQQLVGNFKNFFTMVFDNKDFHVKERLSQSGEVGIYSQLNFLLKVLGMKVDLDLVTEVYFYPEGLYTPMILHMPLDAKKYLKKGSGVIYSWDQRPDFNWQASDVPSLEAMADVKAVLAKHCRASCTFSIKGSAAGAAVGHDVYLHFRLPRYLVAKGFFPVYFADEAELATAIGHKLTTARGGKAAKPARSRSGFYFEAFDLEKGSHRWDLAIDTRKPDQLSGLPCGDLARLTLAPTRR